MTADAPSPTITFLFTDIEGSTQLWEQQPEAMRVALAQHDRLLRQAIEAHQGRLIKTTGDGVHAAFDTAGDAAAAVLAAQRALCAEPWPGLPAPGLRARMALHTGEAEARAGDYYGPTLNRAARLLAIGHGGQILLSAITADLVHDQLPPQATLLDLGQHQLRDLVRPEHVFQLSAPDLPGAFPALRSLGSLPHNLPVQLTSFVGREAALAEARRLLGATHLLTFTGPGGTGKTRLALQLAAEVLESFAHGAWLVELAPLADPSLLPQAVAGALGVRALPGRPLLDTLVDYLRPKSLLLVLDNCEHLIAASAQLAAQLLQACPRLKILATSREALGIAGEATYRVPSLSLAPVDAAAPEALAHSEAVRLFVERAQAVKPRFALTDQNLRVVAHLCERLDGIPLALELAAARMTVLSVEQIAARLDDRFRLLTGGSRAALERHQTLRALIDWSYDLLSEPERAAWRQLSVFAGGFTFEAAEAVIGAEALDWLTHLVGKSLVIAEEDEATGETRYRLLETIRQYGRDKLLEAGEAVAARDRHLAYFRQLACAAELELRGPDLLARLDALDRERDNLRTALEWALERDPAAALEIAARLYNFWTRRDHLIEGRRWLRDSLARFAPVTQAGRRLRALGLYADGLLAFGHGELEAARASLEASVGLARETGDSLTLGLALGMMGFVTIWRGEIAATEAILAEGRRLTSVVDDPILEAQFHEVAAQVAVQQHDLPAARAHVYAAAALARRAGDPWSIAIMVMGIANLDMLEGRYAEARAHLEESEGLFLTLGSRYFAVTMRSERAHVARRAGQHAEAARLYAQTITHYVDFGHRAGALHELECLAFIAVAQAQALPAARLLGAAEALRERFNTPMTALEQQEYDTHVAQLRALAEPEALAAALAEGRSLSLEDAIALALRLPPGVEAIQQS